MVISLRDLETPTFTPGLHDDAACDICGALVANSRTDRHLTYHAEIVAWLRALRDGKVDG